MISKNSKEEIIQRLLITKQRSIALEVRLLVKGKSEEANKIKSKTKALTRQIDQLLSKLMDEWIGQAVMVIGNITKTNAALQTSITKVKNNEKTAENIVKAIGLVDDAINIAKALA